MISVAVEQFRKAGRITRSSFELDSSLGSRGIRVPSLEVGESIQNGGTEKSHVTVVASPTSTILKDIRAARFGLRPNDEHVFVIPPSLVIDGKSFADLEFALYYNAYVLGNISKGRPLQVVCTEQQSMLLKEYLTRTIEGPDWLNPTIYPQVKKRDREMLQRIKEHYAPKDKSGVPLPLETYVNFSTFDAKGRAYVDYGEQGELRIDQITARKFLASSLRNAQGEEIQPSRSLEEFALFRSDEVLGYEVAHSQSDGVNRNIGSLRVAYAVQEMPLAPISQEAKEAILKNRFGFAVTSFGNSTGFDPEGYTTSFVVWMGGTGVLIDPSPEAMDALDTLGIEVPNILLTHCHQDHDAGALRRILQGKRVKLLASNVVFEEFMVKAESLLKCQEGSYLLDPRDLVDFHELKVDGTVELPLDNGEIGKISAWWNIHPIPTNGVGFEYRGKTYGHSGDTQYGKEVLRALVEKGVLTEAEALKHSNRWFSESGEPEFDLIHFEAGGPPIHTKASDLEAAIDPKFQDRVFLYHAPDALVQDGTLRKIGLYETQILIPPTEEDRSKYFTSLMDKHPYFMALDRTSHLLAMSSIEEVPEGTPLITMDSGPLEEMIVLLSGTAVIRDKAGSELGKRGAGTVLGDWSHLTKADPTADVAAETPAIVAKLNLRLLCTIDELMRLREDATFLREITPSFSIAFQKLGVPVNETPSILLAFKDHIQRIDLAPGAELVRQGEKAEKVYVLSAGTLDAIDETIVVDLIETTILGEAVPGDIVGERALIPGAKRRATLRAGAAGATVLAISGEEFKKILDSYPGLRNAFNLKSGAR